MYLVFLLLQIILATKNCFSQKKLRVELIKNSILVYCINPEIVIHEYSFYVCKLLKNSLQNTSKKCVLFYECDSLTFLKHFSPVFYIGLQIEHTLVKPGGRSSKNSPIGNLKIANSNERYLVRIDKVLTLNNFDLVIDYSHINLHNIRSSNQFKSYISKSFCISPALYAPYISTQDREGIITLFGNPEDPRRKKFLDALKNRKIHSKNINGIYLNIDTIYRKTKIVINIRQTDSHDTLEELRVLPALRCGTIVICEAAPFVEKTWYSQFIIWGELTELPQIILDVEKNYNEYHARIFGSAQVNSPFLTRMRRIECCNQLAVTRAINKL